MGGRNRNDTGSIHACGGDVPGVKRREMSVDPRGVDTNRDPQKAGRKAHLDPRRKRYSTATRDIMGGSPIQRERMKTKLGERFLLRVATDTYRVLAIFSLCAEIGI